MVDTSKKEIVKDAAVVTNGVSTNEDIIMQNRLKIAQKLGSPNARKTKT